jgi:hypothetical protein
MKALRGFATLTARMIVWLTVVIALITLVTCSEPLILFFTILKAHLGFTIDRPGEDTLSFNDLVILITFSVSAFLSLIYGAFSRRASTSRKRPKQPWYPLLVLGLAILLHFTTLVATNQWQAYHRDKIVNAIEADILPTQYIVPHPSIALATTGFIAQCLDLTRTYGYLAIDNRQISVVRHNGALSIFFPEAHGGWIHYSHIRGVLYHNSPNALNLNPLLICHGAPKATTEKSFHPENVDNKISRFWYRISYEWEH